MKLSDFDYELPKELIAQQALSERTEARLLILDRKTQTLEHRIFRDLLDYFRPGDVLVLNDTRVLHARLFAKKKTGGKVEILLLKQVDFSNGTGSEGDTFQGLKKPENRETCPPQNRYRSVWQALIRPSRRVKINEELFFADEPNLVARVLDEGDPETGTRRIEFQCDQNFETVLSRVGRVPLPPYISREDVPIDRELYQTVFAKCPGAVASPTAGLHFDQAMLTALRAKGVQIVFVTLHVGYGTFQPVQDETLKSHRMHEEFYDISEGAAVLINQAKKEGRRVVACGTTVVRTLETVASNSVNPSPSPLPCGERDGVRGHSPIIRAGQGNTKLFIYPPFRFKMVDAMITNFHFPRTTLLMLVGAFCGYELMMKAYQEAIREKYRFYSYGDAMMIF
ncbi:MAG: tRNA preQ1(34) S-adenosylmethionine ribosyltransferase-isomerase QueA [Omnitrophica bacterium RIFCSPLOWO2_12_FULL_44_17]|uniref:S-adenosylmethionine:tRNA ribosyltransferase-isomerase n=1 Tax=Candidatus Danuiimicrobium aquiferis TaxID=1801832 RepID=A0A1G1KSB6_9BACT|nr:MAG: tRNA preQ1(34) S-adenosylmethionine ribosyltransferase-isomerase QueA [Omnitrophica bacterium RIFCSPHIGHO2_02_FULL_45_28]OGW89709.1 MAG: tRNA preQ1(34) S-adenosylmethionine ribosyltransferase-isomerase QueA [Omnitrophica bacterium RIFCSPHIGHO2_12_FULL_44_12]OGW95844.1 MAG: tRNA preQ1(34) S-adenosylmethionine ribosyltransferase-isomerase QueA [Omnitrophica bacterium RIFCSPLOWO2_12_FULL_44_17]